MIPILYIYLPKNITIPTFVKIEIKFINFAKTYVDKILDKSNHKPLQTSKVFTSRNFNPGMSRV